MLERVKGALEDAAQTLRRVFGSPATQEAALGLEARGKECLDLLEARGLEGLSEPVAVVRREALEAAALRQDGLEPFEARLEEAPAWARGGEVGVASMALLGGGGSARMELPSLPRKLPAKALPIPRPERPGTRGVETRPKAPQVRRVETGDFAFGVRKGLDLALRMPVPFRSMDLEALPKGLWMRYSLQLVKGTGENVRNLEVVGMYEGVPRKGVLQVRPDRLGKSLLLLLGPEAVGAPRTRFILARRLSDQALLSCYLDQV